MAVRPIDANVAMKKIREYMEDFPNANTRLATCRVILSMLGDESQIPTLIQQAEPLTVEQLRQMDGLPVWIVDIGNRKWYGPSWAIVDREANLVRTVKNWNAAFFEKYGERWIAYRRPPERQEDNNETN